MADAFKFVQAQNFSLAGGGAIAGATSVTLKSFTGIDGDLLTMTDFGGVIGFGTIEPGNGTLEEQICFTGVTQNANGTATLTGVSNVLFVAPYTQTSGLSKTHAGSTTFVISNTSGFYDKFAAKDDDETITGLWTFPDSDGTRARITSDTDTAVATAFVTLGQLSRQAISGASNASTTVKGIVQLSTQAQADAKTTTGSTGALLVNTPELARSTLLSDYKVDTGAANAYVITPVPAISAYTTGQIFSFKATNTNTTTSTLNVSALGVKTIKKLDGATNLSAGDITSGQIVVVEYDGTNFQMINPVSNTAPIFELLGDGSDGPGSISGGTTTLTRDMYYTTLTISGTGVLQPNGFRIFVQGTMTVNGSLTVAGGTGGTAGNGGASSGATGGTAGTAGAAGTTGSSAGTVAGGLAGKIGATGGAGANNGGSPGAGNNGTAGTAGSVASLGSIGAAGGAGGAGGGPGGAGGTAGAAGANGAAAKSLPRNSINGVLMIDMDATVSRYAVGGGSGSGGGGGGGEDDNGLGGGGGGGSGGSGGAGGIIVFACRILAGNGTITAAGGNGGGGGNGGNGVDGFGGSGGGGGGGGNGGIIVAIYFTKTFSGSFLVTAGSAGAAGGAGTSNTHGAAATGTAGSAGTAGTKYEIALLP